MMILPLEAAPFLTFPRKRGKGLVGQNKLSYAPNPILARAIPSPACRGRLGRGQPPVAFKSEPY